MKEFMQRLKNKADNHPTAVLDFLKTMISGLTSRESQNEAQRMWKGVFHFKSS